MMTDLFSIFNPEWWMDENNSALQIADAVLFLLCCIPVAYLLICALFSLGRYKNPYPPSPVQHRFLVLFTVLRNGKEVIESINHFIDTQLYPREQFDIAVAATQLDEEDLITLLQMPLNIVIPDRDSCTKVYAIQQVMERYSPEEYDVVLLLNSDNHICPNALELINKAYYSGCDAIQLHRMARNLTTPVAIVSATSEEINNNLFRKAHTRMGFSSALLGSAMAFDFPMFHSIAPTLKGGDTATAVEIALLKQNIYTEYLEEVICYSRKEEDHDGFQQLRLRWAEAKYYNKGYALLHLPLALLRGEWDLANKLFQWTLPSRFLLLLLLAVLTLIVTIADWTLCMKWYLLFSALIIAFLMALPEGEINHRFRRVFWMIPYLVVKSVFSPLRRKLFHKKRRKEKKA